MTARNFFAFALVISALGLSGCNGGGSDDPGSDFVGGTGGSAGSGGTGTGGTGGATTTLRIGHFNGATFVPGVVGVASTPAQPVQGGTTTQLFVSVVDLSNRPVLDALTIRFGSRCTSGGQAEIDPGSVSTSTGGASVDYTPLGCTPQDDLIAELVIGESTLRATGTIQTLPCPGGSCGGGGGAPVFRIGHFQGQTFVASQIGIGQPVLSSGGTSGLFVSIIDQSGFPISDVVNVAFSSPCASAGTADIDPGAIDTVNGGAQSTYTAQGCTGTDNLLARAVVGGTTLTATGQIQLQPSTAGSIQFISASNNPIGIRGTGFLPETSAVTFQVNNTAGGPVEGATVIFSLDTMVGDISISPTSAVSGVNGRVSTTVTSGTRATVVRVRAETTVNTVTIFTQSDSLTITTGVADNNSMSLSATCFNRPTLLHDGIIIPVTIRAADGFNNPVPNGTAVSFQTEGGAIVGSCLTGPATNPGACTVNWFSQNPRPGNFCTVPDPLPFGDPANDNSCRAGRSTVLATAIGVESFVDANGNGRFNSGEPFGDIGEAILDVNGAGGDVNGLSSPDSQDLFVDFNSSGGHNGPSSNYTGVLCDSGCDTARTLSARDEITLIMSGNTPDNNFFGVSPGFSVGENGVITFASLLRDLNLQPMPQGTIISISTGGGGFTTIAPASFTVPCTTDDSVAANTYFLSVKAPDDCTPPKSDLVTISVLTPTPANINTIFQFGVSCP